MPFFYFLKFIKHTFLLVLLEDTYTYQCLQQSSFSSHLAYEHYQNIKSIWTTSKIISTEWYLPLQHKLILLIKYIDSQIQGITCQTDSTLPSLSRILGVSNLFQNLCLVLSLRMQRRHGLCLQEAPGEVGTKLCLQILKVHCQTPKVGN